MIGAVNSFQKNLVYTNTKMQKSKTQPFEDKRNVSFKGPVAEVSKAVSLVVATVGGFILGGSLLLDKTFDSMGVVVGGLMCIGGAIATLMSHISGFSEAVDRVRN